MNLAKYLSIKRGQQEDLCKKIGAYPSDMSRWAKGRRPVPAHYCPAIEEFTNGMVTRKELRPKDYWKYWTDLAKEVA